MDGKLLKWSLWHHLLIQQVRFRLHLDKSVFNPWHLKPGDYQSHSLDERWSQHEEFEGLWWPRIRVTVATLASNQRSGGVLSEVPEVHENEDLPVQSQHCALWSSSLSLLIELLRCLFIWNYKSLWKHLLVAVMSWISKRPKSLQMT